MVAVPGAIGYIRAGMLIPLGVTSARPVAALPDVSPIAQAGLPTYKINAWHGILGPAKMSPALVKRLEQDITYVLTESVSKPGDDPPPSVLRKSRSHENRVSERRRPAIKAVFKPSAVGFETASQ
jgi:hypothetical protein